MPTLPADLPIGARVGNVEIIGPPVRTGTGSRYPARCQVCGDQRVRDRGSIMEAVRRRRRRTRRGPRCGCAGAATRRKAAHA